LIVNKEKNFISVVVYIHNNQNEIENYLDKLNTLLFNRFEMYEIICVNDASKDKSIDRIKKFSTINSPIITIVNMSIYQGIELSMNAGVDLAIGDFVFEFDSLIIDYDLSLILDIYFKSLNGFDIVNACPDKIINRKSKLFYFIFNRYSKSYYKIRTDRFRLLSRRAINRVYSMSKTIPYRKALYASSGLKMESQFYQPINFISQKYDIQNKENRREIAIDSLILLTDLAQKISITLSLILFAFTFIAGAYTLSIYLSSSKPIEGWTTTMLLLSGGFSGVFLILTIIIKYLTLLVDLVFKKQKYLIESIEKVNSNKD
jgi:hypothetical protein